MVIWIGMGVAIALTAFAELLHGSRVRRIKRLAFGPMQRAAHWTAIVPLLRTLGAGLLAWGLLTLLLDVDRKVHRADAPDPADFRHLVLVLDVSPSMRLQDAGPDAKQSRLRRARDVLQSMFSRVSIGRYKISIVATYNGAIPVVIDTTDAEVVRNVLSDLPIHYAFKAGETKLFAGLAEAAKIARPWKPKSATVVVVSDGETLPATGMIKMPPSVAGVLVIGVGDPITGSFINGRNSRQDVSALRQMALRLGGTYHDGNKRHVATTVLSQITDGGTRSAVEQLTKREYALMAVGLGAGLLALLPLLLHFFGTRWRPGVQLEAGRNPRSGRTTRYSQESNDDRLRERRA